MGLAGRAPFARLGDSCYSMKITEGGETDEENRNPAGVRGVDRGSGGTWGRGEDLQIQENYGVGGGYAGRRLQVRSTSGMGGKGDREIRVFLCELEYCQKQKSQVQSHHLDLSTHREMHVEGKALQTLARLRMGFQPIAHASGGSNAIRPARAGGTI